MVNNNLKYILYCIIMTCSVLVIFTYYDCRTHSLYTSILLLSKFGLMSFGDISSVMWFIKVDVRSYAHYTLWVNTGMGFLKRKNPTSVVINDLINNYRNIYSNQLSWKWNMISMPLSHDKILNIYSYRVSWKNKTRHRMIDSRVVM